MFVCLKNPFIIILVEILEGLRSEEYVQSAILTLQPHFVLKFKEKE